MWLSRRDWLRLAVAGAGFAGLGAAAVAGWRARPDVAVGSKDFPEQWILSELLAAVVARATGRAAGRVILNGTLLCHRALVAGDIQAYVEYTGTAYTAVLHRSGVTDPREVYRIVAVEYARQFDLIWLPPLGFENTFAVLVRGDDARRRGLRAISDLRPIAGALRVAVPFEFFDRPDGYRGLVRAYGLEFPSAPRQMSLGNVYRALAAGDIDVGVGNSTDGLIAHLGLVHLVDDRRYFPPYEPAPVVRRAFARAQPAAIAALRALSGRITTEAMRRANFEVDHEKRHPKP
ncbi:MAG: ABC transporter substrate-binding protein, partial [Deltaproteobacteria bacterium]